MQASFPPSALHWNTPPSLKVIAFDFDDTLVESRAIVEESYRRAGVTTFPDGWYGTPGVEWLPKRSGRQVYMLKQLHYMELIKTAPALPPAILARNVSHFGTTAVALLTAAEDWTIKTRVDTLNVRWNYQYTGCRHNQKVVALQELGQTGVYIDDLDDGANIAAEAGWKFIKYEDQTAFQLLGELG